MKTLIATLSLILLSAPGSTHAQDLGTLDIHSYKDVMLGKTLSQVEKDVGQSIQLEGENIDGCYSGTFAKYPGISFLIIDGVVSRAEILDAQIKTEGGVTLGSTPEAAMSQFPQIKKEEHAYVHNGYYLTLSSQKFGMRFEVIDGYIAGVSAGLLETVELVEGCL